MYFCTAKKTLSLQPAATWSKKLRNVPQTGAQNLICSQTLLHCSAIERVRQPQEKANQAYKLTAYMTGHP